MKGDLYPRSLELIGKEDADHFVENWRILVIVSEKGELRQLYSRSRKPS